MLGKYIKPVLLFVVLAAVSVGCTHKLVRVSDMKEIPVADFVANAKNVRIVFAGELHDMKTHHDLQLEIIRSLEKAGADLAIGVEMFPTDEQTVLDKWVAGGVSEDDFRKAYAKHWRIPWGKYREIFVYARDRHIPVVALNVERSLIHQVFEKGLDSLTPEQKKQFPPGIKCNVDPEYAAFIKEAMGEHEMDDATFEKFCNAQMVWDSAMAKNAVDYLEKNPGKKMVVLAGSGHAWKRGIPEQLEKLSKIEYLVVLPEDSETDSFSITSKDADYVWTGWFLY